MKKKNCVKLLVGDNILFIPRPAYDMLDTEELEDELLLTRLATFVLHADTFTVVKNRHSLEDVFEFYTSSLTEL